MIFALVRSFSACKMLALFNWDKLMFVIRSSHFHVHAWATAHTFIVSSHSKHQMLQSHNTTLMCMCSDLVTEWLLLFLLLLTPWGNIEWPGSGLHSWGTVVWFPDVYLSCAVSVLAVGPSLFSRHQRLCPQVKWPGCEAYLSD
jgi:hypothetical protein